LLKTPLFPLPLQTAPVKGNTNVFLMKSLNCPCVSTNKGQYGADFHFGTLSVPTHFSISSFTIVLATTLGGGTNQLFSFFHT
jgi:hypothetical protein